MENLTGHDRECSIDSRVEMSGSAGMEGYDTDETGYPHICTVLEILGAKWSLLVIAELHKGPRRFQQLLRDVAIVRTQSLTNVLRQLEKSGIVHREVYPSVPVSVEYSLTEKGMDFQAALKEMENWAIRWGNDGRRE